MTTLQSLRSPGVPGGATGSNIVFSLWKGETELGLLTTGNGGVSGAGSELVMMAAVHVVNSQAEKIRGGGKKRHDKKKGQPPTSSTPVQILMETTFIRGGFTHKKRQCIYFYFFILPTIKPVTTI